jgi:hypothetical protein
LVASGSLPPGLSLDPNTGVLSGTPTTPGTYQFRVEVGNFGNGTAGPLTTITLSVPAIAAGALLITDSGRLLSLPAGGGSQELEDANLSYGSDVAVDAKGDMFIDGAGDNKIVELRAGGGNPILLGTGLDLPAGIAVDAKGDVFVADSGNNRVVELPAGGGAQVTIGTGLKRPEGVAVDAEGDVFIADTGNSRVVEVGAGNGAETTVGSGLSTPKGVAVDAAGDVYIADYGNNRVVKVAAGTTTQTTVASGLGGPWSVTLDAVGDVFIAEAGTGGVVELLAAGGRKTVGTGLTGTYGVAAFAPAPAFTADTPPATVALGDSYSYTYAATVAAGQPAPTFVVASGNLPPGLSLSAATGKLSGTTTASGSFSFVVQVENRANGTLGPKTTVAVPAGAVFTADTPPAHMVTGTDYRYTFRASGYPSPKFAVSAGKLPLGLGLDATTGLLAGSPTKRGTYRFTVAASNGVGRVATSPTITITVTRPLAVPSKKRAQTLRQPYQRYGRES